MCSGLCVLGVHKRECYCMWMVCLKVHLREHSCMFTCQSICLNRGGQRYVEGCVCTDALVPVCVWCVCVSACACVVVGFWLPLCVKGS